MNKLFAFVLSIMLLTVLPAAKSQADSTDIVNGMNGFAFSLYQTVHQPDQNVILSPYSLSFLLELLVSGSAGNTQVQLANAFQLDKSFSLAALNADLNLLNTNLQKNKDLAIANAFWADEKLVYQPEFLLAMGKISDKSVKRVNFSGAPDQAKVMINDWVNTATHGYIKTILDSPLSTNTRLVLTNAVYFKGLWAMPFNVERTQKRAFKMEDGKTRQVSMMNIKDHFNYVENDELQLLQLNYADSTLAMVIMLPKEKRKLQDVLQSLDNTKFMSLVASAGEAKPEVVVTLPKFKLNSQFNTLPANLKQLGITDVFDQEKSDFSNMVTGAGAGSLYISDIIQKAIIEVDEKGTVAAAATAVVISTRAAMVNPKPVIHFTADHPFLFIIYDTQSQLILFMGQVARF